MSKAKTNAERQAEWRERQRQGPKRTAGADQPCGTARKARWHRRQGETAETMDAACLDAERKANRAR